MPSNNDELGRLLAELIEPHLMSLGHKKAAGRGLLQAYPEICGKSTGRKRKGKARHTDTASHDGVSALAQVSSDAGPRRSKRLKMAAPVGKGQI